MLLCVMVESLKGRMLENLGLMINNFRLVGEEGVNIIFIEVQVLFKLIKSNQ